MKYSQKNEEAYQEVYQILYDELQTGNFFIDEKAVRRGVRKINSRIKSLCFGVNFANSLEEVDKVDDTVEMLKGRKRAYQDILKYVRKRIKETELLHA